MTTPEHILKKLRRRHDLADDDTSKDEELEALPAMSKFREVVAWELGNPAWADQVVTWANACGLQVVDPDMLPKEKARTGNLPRGQLSSLVKNLLGIGDAFSLGIMDAMLRQGMDFNAAAEHARNVVTKIANVEDSGAYSIEALNGMVEELYESARKDKLTGLLMRAAFEKEYSRLQDGWNALVLIDCDHFKRVNDTLGHDAGDKVLQAIASIIKDTVRAIDVACRWGGDEFVILLPRANLDDAKVVAERLRHAAANADLRGVTLSIGVTMSSHHEDLVQVLQRADAAMYSAKRGGKNAVAVH